jgi:serine protease
MLACVLVLLVAATGAAAVAAAPAPQGQAAGLENAAGVEFVPGEILVKFRSGTSEAARAAAHSALGGRTLAVNARGGYERVAIGGGNSVADMVRAYAQNPNVLYAQPNSTCQALMTPNDPLYPKQWHFPMINMPQAWDLQTGNASVIVAIVDTGIAYENYGAYQVAPDLATASFAPGYDFINNDAHPNDDHYHGTHVAGTVAQNTNNSLGVAGIAFNTTLMPVKVLNSAGSGTADSLASGLYWAGDHGAKVVNMSLGWSPGYDPGPVVHDAVIYCYNAGVVLCSAAGNNGTSTVVYPAAYPECIAVGALNSATTLAYYSNYGARQEVVAPGGDSTDRDGDGNPDGVLQQTFASGSPTSFGYYYLSGTSMATPHVAGTVALLIAHGATGVENIRTILHETAVDLGTVGWDSTFGYGMIDAYHALQHVGPVQPGVAQVQRIDMVLKKSGASTYAEATIYVVDGYGSPLADATVNGQWSGATSDTDTGITNSSGVVVFQSNKVKKPKSGAVFTVTVTNVAKTNYTFQPGPYDTKSIIVP